METQRTVTESNRRKAPRFERSVAMEIGASVPAKTLDLSTSGFSAAMPNTFVPGQFINGTFVILGHRFAFEAQVRWSVENARFGARFTGVDPKLRQYAKGVPGLSDVMS